MSDAAITFPNEPLLEAHTLSVEGVTEAWEESNRFLRSMPRKFGMGSVGFYSIVNQRNLSGLVGEVFRFSLAKSEEPLVPNPHPDGRPDLLDLSVPDARDHFETACFDQSTGAPKRSELAPFMYGGLEVKCSIGKVQSASQFGIGVSRIDSVTGLTYWAHHRHALSLLGAYYDYCKHREGAPQIKALFLADIEEADWGKVSIGRADRKKTSNTSLLRSGLDKVRAGLVAYEDRQSVVRLLRRLKFANI